MIVLPPRLPQKLRLKKRQVWLVRISMLLCCIACDDDCQPIEDGRGFICGGASTTASIEPAFSLPVIPARLGDRPLHLLVDTGAETTVLSAALLKRPDASSFRLETSLCIGDGFCLKQLPVYAWDTPLSSPETDGINGVLGMDILQHFTFIIHTGTTIELHFQSGGCDGASLPLTYTTWGAPQLDVQIDDVIVADVLLDTGAAVCLLDDATVKLLDPYFEAEATQTTGCTIDGCVEEGVFQSAASRICIGDHCQTSVETKFPAWNAVGSSYFFAYHIAFDFIRDELIFCETKTSP